MNLLAHCNQFRVASAFSLARQRLTRLAFACWIGAFATFPVLAQADESDHEQMVFFEAKVRPLLAERCWSCHGEESQKGGLRLDSRSAMMLGGDSGAAVIPEQVDASLLIEAVRYQTYEMPPDGKLAEKEIATLEEWVQRGAYWPGSSDSNHGRPESTTFSESDFQWWAIQPVSETVVPDGNWPQSGWARNDLDRFVLDAMQTRGLSPAPQADRATIIRRLYFDLTGLPPSPTEIESFLQDTDPDAYENLVDRLLDSPEYGERWARHWLDLVRYADSDGYRADHYRPDAWRYRDYVIDSLNNDKPYDRFVREQLAGDELYPGNPEALVATGFLRNGIYEYNIRDVVGQWNVILNEITDTTGDVFLGLGMQCARCHDHKFDPILQSDYFRLRAYFEPLAWRDDLTTATDDEVAEFEKQDAIWLEQTQQIRSEIDEIERSYKQTARATAVGRFPLNIQAMFETPLEERTPAEKQIVDLAYRQVLFEYENLETKIKGEQKDRLLELRRELAKFDNLRPKPLPSVMCATDIGPISPPTIIPKKNKEVDPGTLALLNARQATGSNMLGWNDVSSTEYLVRSTRPASTEVAESDVISTAGLGSTALPHQTASTGRRSELARWITSPDNPLTVRVIVNRIWQYHFGRGLATNTSDFGNLGGPPSHPELLDHLSMRFLENGWRLKPLHRLMVTSATYRQSSNNPQFDTFNEIDPTNTWYWRFNSRRLDAEQIRDSLLFVTNQLDTKRGGPGSLGDQSRRSIYTRVMRNAPDPLLEIFDLPLFFTSSSSRNTTTTPIQSLHLFNSPAMLKFSRDFADHIEDRVAANGDVFEQGTQSASKIAMAWQMAFGCLPQPEEMTRGLSFLDQQAAMIRNQRESNAAGLQQTSQMPYRDGQSVLFKPEDGKNRLRVPANEKLELTDFTFETYFQVRSIYESGAVRTIAASGSGTKSTTGWAIGVTGKGSRRKPQTMVLQLFGPATTSPDQIAEAAIFSDQHVALNTPYYLGITVRFAKVDQPGEVVFYLKNLSDDETPMSIARQEHQITQLQIDGAGNSQANAIRIGGRGQDTGARFDGLIDDIRLSSGILSENELLVVQESVRPSTIAYWQFEVDPGFYRDSGANELNLISTDSETSDAKDTLIESEKQAFIDFCHVLLNSNSFLYVY